MKYKVNDRVRIKSIDWYNENNVNGDDILENIGIFPFFPYMARFCGQVLTIKDIHITYYTMEETDYYTCWTDEMIEGIVEEEIKPKVLGEVSDGYHTFNELYEYRMLYNAALFNEFAKQGLYDVHKSRKHSDGEYPFGDSNWFIVIAELPTGQISNHYEMKDWDKFQIPEKPLANKWDGHSPKDVADKLTSFTTPKKEYPKTYEECCKVMNYCCNPVATKTTHKEELIRKFQFLLLYCDAYWKIAGEEMGLGKPWEPDWQDDTTHKFIIHAIKDKIHCGVSLVKNHLLAFPTEGMRDAFYENFKELIESCKELL